MFRTELISALAGLLHLSWKEWIMRSLGWGSAMKLSITRLSYDERLYSIDSAAGTRYGMKAAELARWLRGLRVADSAISAVLDIAPNETILVGVPQSTGLPVERVARCRDAGLDCDFEARGQSEKEILEMCAAHVRSVHGMDENPFELAERIVAACRDKESKAA
jgi:predicted small metal-binding protein